MKIQHVTFAVLTAIALGGVGNAFAEDQLRTQDQLKTQDKDQLMDKDQDRDRLRDQDQDRIYGYELMTTQERTEYRNRMRAAKTLQERERIREEHRLLMDARAKERGVKILHANPPAAGMGAGKK